MSIEPMDDRLLAIAREYCLTRFNYPDARVYTSPEAREECIDIDARSVMAERWWRTVVPLLLAEGRRQADSAISWQTSCVGCATGLDRAIAERAAGYAEGRQRVATWPGHVGLLEAARAWFSARYTSPPGMLSDEELRRIDDRLAGAIDALNDDADQAEPHPTTTGFGVIRAGRG